MDWKLPASKEVFVMSTDLNLISKIVETRSLLAVYQMGIKATHLEGSAERAIWDYIEQHYQLYKQIPSSDVIFQKFDVHLPTVVDGIEFLGKEILERSLHRDLANLSTEMVHALTNSTPSAAFDVLRTFVRTQLDQRASNAKLIPFGAMVEDLKTAYLDAESGKMGIPTPWPQMNEWTMGWFPGDLSFFSGRLGTGKTFILLLIAVAARAQGHRVLFISGEMSCIDIGKRAAAITAKLPYSELRRGKLSALLKDAYFDFLEKNRTDVGFEIMDASLGFQSSDIELAIDKTSADLILIDASYRIKASQKTRDRFENMAMVADDLKAYAMRYKKPIVATTQLNRASSSKKSYGDDDIALSDVVGWNSTNLFAIKQTDQDRENRTMSIFPLKVREGENTRSALVVGWNMGDMDFSERQGGSTTAPSNSNRGLKDDEDNLAW
jgi:KaiC/GvpD/RAD55 family RecA-like ATPase